MACAERQHHNIDAFSARTSGFRPFDFAPYVKGHPTRRPNPSTSSCADVCTCPSLCPCVPADVAANLTCLAIIVRAPWRGGVGENKFPFGGGRCPSVPRQEPASPETSTSRDMDLAEFNNLDGDVWRSSQMVLTLWQGAQLAIGTTSGKLVEFLCFSGGLA